jgi:Caspase domain
MKSLAVALLVTSAAASAASHRIAVVVGANRGALGRPDLRYSYRDAQDVAETLIQVGEFKPDDVHVLHDPSPEVILASLDRELGTLRAAGGESLLVFYYSGHADGAALYPAGQPLPFSDLRARLENGAATVRLVLEVPPGRRALKLSVPAGRYLLRRETPQGTEAREIGVEPGRSVQVREEELQLTGLAARNGKGVAEGGVEAWPLSLNDRPLTFYRGVVQIDVGLVGLLNRGAESSSSTRFAPAFRYGVTDRATLSLSANSICLGSSLCAVSGGGVGVELALGLPSAGPADFAVSLGTTLDLAGAAYHSGIQARARGGPFALLVTPQVRYVPGTSPRDVWRYLLVGQLQLQATERFAMDAVTLLQAPLASPNPFARDPVDLDGGVVPVVLGATYALGRHWDARAQFTFANVLPHGTFGPGDQYAVGFYLSLRP